MFSTWKRIPELPGVLDIRILQVTPFFTPARGGIVSVAGQLSEELRTMGHKVTILTTDFERDTDFAKSISEKGIDLVMSPCRLEISSFLLSPSMAEWLYENIHNYDIVHMHGFRTYQNILASKYARMNGIPLVLQPHGTLPIVLQRTIEKMAFDLVWGNKILRSINICIAVSQLEVDQFQSVGIPKEKIRVVPNGIRTPQGSEPGTYKSFRTNIGIDDHMRIVLYLGRIHRGKGLDELIRAFRGIATAMPDVMLVIAGPDEGYVDELKRLVTDMNINGRVKFTGFIRDVRSAYREVDLVVYPPGYEIFGLVPLEALLERTPIVVTDACGCAEFVKKYECGFIARYGDIEDLQNQISHALTLRESAEEMADRGKRFVEEHLSWPRITTRVEKIYEDCVHI